MTQEIAIGIDFETTGIDANNSEVIEYALVTYCTAFKSMISSLSNLVKPTKEIGKETELLTGINQLMLNNYGIEQNAMITHINMRFKNAKYLIAHNAEFEISFLDKMQGLEYKHLEIIDTMKDINYPPFMKNRDLERLSLYHKCPNLNAHRALPDTLTMLNILSQYEFSKILEYKNIPTVKIISLAGFDKKDLVKGLGFFWDANNRFWFMDIKINFLENIENSLKENDIKYRIQN